MAKVNAISMAILKFNGHQFGNRTIVVDGLFQRKYILLLVVVLLVVHVTQHEPEYEKKDLKDWKPTMPISTNVLHEEDLTPRDCVDFGWILAIQLPGTAEAEAVFTNCWRPSDMIGVDGYAGWCCDSILWLALDPTTDVLFCLGGGGTKLLKVPLASFFVISCFSWERRRRGHMTGQ
ncbi:hypothetical protein Dimus_015353 [Dionaea muscipula]